MPVDQFLPSHEKTAKLARALGWSPRYAVGVLVELWGWAVDHQSDGYIERSDPGTLAKALRMSRAELAQVTLALREVGWIDPAGPTQGRFHKWEKWGGRIVERRKEDADRQDRRRKRLAEAQASRVTEQARQPAEQGRQGGLHQIAVTADVTRDRGSPSRWQTRQDKTRTPSPRSDVTGGREGEKTTGAVTRDARELTDQRTAEDIARAELLEQARAIVDATSGLWHDALELLLTTHEEDGKLGVFISRYRDTELVKTGDDSYELQVPNEFAASLIRDKAMSDVCGAVGVRTGTFTPRVEVRSRAVPVRKRKTPVQTSLASTPPSGEDRRRLTGAVDSRA
jgi:hypothetical protein